jgi:hypothetical protein
MLAGLAALAGCQGESSGPAPLGAAASEPGLYYNPHSLACNSIRAQSEGFC